MDVDKVMYATVGHRCSNDSDTRQWRASPSSRAAARSRSCSCTAGAPASPRGACWASGRSPGAGRAGRGRLAGPRGGGLCEPGVRDAAPCHSTWSGDAYAPNCHDAAWALALAALVLAPPALCAAAAGRRARLRRRDRALERRLLPRAREASAAPPAELRALVVPRAALELLDELGAGHYGSVRLGVLRRARGPPLAVAAKAARAGAGAADAAGDLVREGALLAALRHDHVVRLAAVVLEAEGAPLLLMEHAFHGDLQRYLRARRPALERARAGEPEPEAAHVGALALTRLAREAAAALGYLALHRVVHRDVRAANCLVDARRSLRLADFGLARRLDAPADEAPGAAEYLCRRRALFPVLWMAPESLARGVFSAATDVWALGVLVLELATLGARPFGAWPAPRVLGHVRAGGSPPLPRDAAASTRGLVATCWRRAADERPTAAQLVAWLAAHPRAVRPALAPPAGGDRPPPAGGDRPPHGDDGLYLEEWTA
ncbi:hypothetical protein MSG28_002566 [Choristoneura fumiferana]|uniref:Uncharacterized protein n=1 Tax=Choristoneura fumiferana TaxID=7141 RepID=A0ACC0JW14_CHOFU|nr:hypothetical protein MSG28_002566 [Choristoneura fumiferana]